MKSYFSSRNFKYIFTSFSWHYLKVEIGSIVSSSLPTVITLLQKSPGLDCKTMSHKIKHWMKLMVKSFLHMYKSMIQFPTVKNQTKQKLLNGQY